MNNVSAYIIGVVVAVVMLVVAAVVSNLIVFRPDNSDCKSRKVWFWVLGALTPVLSFFVAFFAVYVGIKANSKQESYMIAMAVSTVLSFVIYGACGFVLSKANKHGKLGNWF